MAKYNILKVFVLVVIWTVMLNGCDFTYKIKVRPLRIKVIDSSTKKPLKNIVVYYVLESYVNKDKILFFIPSPEPKSIIKVESKKVCFTDSRGEVQFDGGELILKKDEKLYAENVYINLNIKSESLIMKEHKHREQIDNLHFYFQFYAVDKDKFFNPDKRFKGYYIQSTTWKIDAIDFGGSARDKLDILWNGEGLLKEKENFLIELKQY